MTADRYGAAVIETAAAAVVVVVIATAAVAVVIVVDGDAVAVGSVVVLCARPSVVPSSAMRVVWCPPRHVPDALHWH